jgi:hypothetical protein
MGIGEGIGMGIGTVLIPIPIPCIQQLLIAVLLARAAPPDSAPDWFRFFLELSEIPSSNLHKVLLKNFTLCTARGERGARLDDLSLARRMNRISNHHHHGNQQRIS